VMLRPIIGHAFSFAPDADDWVIAASRSIAGMNLMCRQMLSVGLTRTRSC
jgi:hypothetical protein